MVGGTILWVPGVNLAIYLFAAGCCMILSLLLKSGGAKVLNTMEMAGSSLTHRPLLP